MLPKQRQAEQGSGDRCRTSPSQRAFSMDRDMGLWTGSGQPTSLRGWKYSPSYPCAHLPVILPSCNCRVAHFNKKDIACRRESLPPGHELERRAALALPACILPVIPSCLPHLPATCGYAQPTPLRARQPVLLFCLVSRDLVVPVCRHSHVHATCFQRDALCLYAGVRRISQGIVQRYARLLPTPY